ncbi:anti sigma factor C-terminal domain-containing protein [Clostridium nigeriense]|uniref:anti sigma factor C-terminal domain-containing protein n=1 Tax=Clostridium nigeriense TaxID=1805470 RepID=UPI003D33810A
MSFKYIFEKYKNGTATEEEIKIIEEEIEKNELINDYLSENIFGEIDNISDNIGLDEIDTKVIKKAVNKKFRKVVVLSVVSVLLIIILINFLILPSYNNFFYNPSRKITNQQNQDELFIDMSTFTELHLPGYTTDNTNVEGLGLGKYDITINQNNLFTGENVVFNGKVVRNELITQNNNLFKFPAIDAFYDVDNKNVLNINKDGSSIYGQNKEEREYLINNVKELPKGSVISSYISFKKDLSLDELKSLEKKYNFTANWIAIRTTDSNTYTKVGFDPTGTGVIIESGTLSEEDYPCFELGNEEYDNGYSAEILEKHFKSLLKYMSSREDFLNTFFNVNNISSTIYSEVLSYIESNGIKTYGILLYTDVDTFLNLIEDENIYTISIDNAKFSVFQR